MEDVAEAWRIFLAKKFSVTQEEALKPPMEPLPEPDQGEVLTEEEILKGLAKMSNNKAHGIDEIPVEVYKCNPLCKRLLTTLLQKIWVTEEIPT